nr:uncharacterized protein LOC113828294 [Penaeus vannamei]
MPSSDGHQTDVSYKTHLVIGDFNGHSTQWGYNNQNGENAIIARLRRGYNPDLIFISNRRQVFQRNVLDHIPRSQHRPVEANTQPIRTMMPGPGISGQQLKITYHEVVG